jgi:hypothetical protein
MNDGRLLRVAEVRDDHLPTLESDPYIPVKISWIASGLRQGPPPVYVRVSGLAGGEVEFRIDRASGDLLVVTILSLGATVAKSAPAYPDIPHEEGCRVVVDRTLWESARGNVVDIDLLLRPYPLPQGVRVDIAGVEPARLIECGPRLTLALDTDGFFASVAARIDIDKRHFRS